MYLCLKSTEMTWNDSIKSNRRFNKMRKQYPLCKDDKGNQLYPNDYIKIDDPSLGGPYCAIIYYDICYGAFISAHPNKIKQSGYHDEFLHIYLNKSRFNKQDAKFYKITKTEYYNWVSNEKIKDRFDLRKPARFWLDNVEPF